MVNAKGIETYDEGDSAEYSPGKVRKLFSCQLDLGPGHTEETLFMVGPDSEGQVMALWRETAWDDEGASAVAWTAKGFYEEPEVWRRLLEAYLRVLREQESFEGHEFNDISSPSKGPLSMAEIKAAFGKVWGG
ncbi:MAG: hypothetical protein FJ410_08830 [Verrucomicrobia bacterium]|nr:hypothetical protein [Verrucomicrobiota bacterium]